MQGDSGTPPGHPRPGEQEWESVGQPLLVSGIPWGFSIHGWTGILHLPGVQSFCPRGASCTHRSFPPAQGQGIGWVDVICSPFCF